MIACPNCNKTHSVVHPERNRCSCGQGFDGNGKIVNVDVPHVVIKAGRLKEESASEGFHNKPGSALESLIPQWAVSNSKGCKCRDKKKQMDRLGTDGCKQTKNYEMLVDHLVKQSDRLIPMLRGIPHSFRERGARRLLDKAIKLSEE